MKFRKRVQILPGVRLNFSSKGVSTTIGPKGLNVNVGKKGTYLNTGIPGTGLYDRHKIAGKSKEVQPVQRRDPIISQPATKKRSGFGLTGILVSCLVVLALMYLLG